MITNDRQYRITRVQAGKFEQAIEAARKAKPRQGIDPRVHMAMVEAMESDLKDLNKQLTRYRRVSDGKVRFRKLRGLEGLPDALIEARIARQWTQKDLAAKLGLKEQQIQRYEKERYQTASLDRIVDVAAALGVRWKSDVTLPAKTKTKTSAKTKPATPPTRKQTTVGSPTKSKAAAKTTRKTTTRTTTGRNARTRTSARSKEVA